MLNQLLKFTLISSVLLWLKPRWRSLLVLCVVVVAVHIFHGEYLNYAELSGNQSFLVWSYIIKWGVLIVSVLLYMAYTVARQNDPKTGARRVRNKKNGKVDLVPAPDDGFDFLRKKNKLQSRAEKIIGENKSNQ